MVGKIWDRVVDAEWHLFDWQSQILLPISRSSNGFQKRSFIEPVVDVALPIVETAIDVVEDGVDTVVDGVEIAAKATAKFVDDAVDTLFGWIHF